LSGAQEHVIGLQKSLAMVREASEKPDSGDDLADAVREATAHVGNLQGLIAAAAQALHARISAEERGC
jgi:hypothetical protein